MNIVVLCAGTSTEREVSINTGAKVCEALRIREHNAIMLDVFFGTEDINLLDKTVEKYDIEAEKTKISHMTAKVEEIKKQRKGFFGMHVLDLCSEADIVFMALHGENGENGKVQAAFDLMGIKYTGTGCLGSAIAMDKGISKQIFVANKISTPAGVWLKKGESTDLAQYGMSVPCVVKPCCGGSSVGVTIVDNEKDYQAALKESFQYEDEVVVEQYVKGREFSVGVLGKKALPVIEIIPKQGFYDYKNKYIAGMTEEICPAKLSEEETIKMQKIAIDVCEVLKLEAYARVDILMDEKGKMYCLEANTLPGMTATSLLPQEAAVVGLPFPELCDKLIELSLEKYN